MKMYLVGGAVRDQLLGRTPKDRDYVVVGATIQEMLDLGYEQVGASFPVFLHPETKEEYALARIEKSTGPKHTDFEFMFEPTVSLKEDLYRRDLTINSIAYDIEEKKYIDYFGGLQDLHNKTLRHVSQHFMEDPLRVLRVARFASQLDFEVHPDLTYLMKLMGLKGDLNTLTGERVFMELDKALGTKKPSVFFNVLKEAEVLENVFPTIYDMIGVEQNLEHHPEGDVYNHTMLAIDYYPGTREVTFATLCHDFGKTLTPKEQLPKHHGHDKKGLYPVDDFCNRLKVPNKYRHLAEMGCRYHMNCHRVFEMRPQKILKMIKEIGGLRDFENIDNFVEICENDYYGRNLERSGAYKQGFFLRNVTNDLINMKTRDLVERFEDRENKNGLIQALHKRRLKIIRDMKKEYFGGKI